jgi:hypothetical protein
MNERKPLDTVKARQEVEAALGVVETLGLADANEATTRCEVVDRILAAVGWPREALHREMPSGAGEFLDYCLTDREVPWIVVEAKRIGQTFRLPLADDGRSLVSPIRSLMREGGKGAMEALKQASKYCNDRAMPFACITNGRQWVFFRGLSISGRTWQDGKAVVFSSPQCILGNFETFLMCLSPEFAFSPKLPALLEGATSVEIPQSRVPLEAISMVRRTPDGDDVAELRALARRYLGDLHKVPGPEGAQLLSDCYVSPGPEKEFSSTLSRLLRDSADAIDLEVPVEEADLDSFARILREDGISSIDLPVVVAGHVGAGKTTFLHKTLSHLRENGDAISAFVDLEGRGQSAPFDAGREEAGLAEIILKKLSTSAMTTIGRRDDLADGKKVFADPWSPASTDSIFHQELRDRKAMSIARWESDPNAWLIERDQLLQRCTERHVDFLVRYARHLHSRIRMRSGRPYPMLIVLDNVDKAVDEYQRMVHGLALQLTKHSPLVAVVALRESSLAKEPELRGKQQTSSIQQVFHVGSPPITRLLRARLAFCEAIRDRKLLFGTGSANWPESLNLLCQVVRTLATRKDKSGVELIAAIAGHDTRNVLELVRTLVVDAAGSRQVPDGSACSVADAMFAQVSRGLGPERFGVANCFDTSPSSPPFHAIRTRLLAYFDWAHSSSQCLLFEDRDRAEANFSAWGYPASSVHFELQTLIDLGLLRSRSAIGSGRSERVSITATGHAHLHKLISLPVYRVAMAMKTRWYDVDGASQFAERANEAGGSGGTTFHDILASSARLIFEAYLRARLTAEEGRLSKGAQNWHWVKEVLTRSKGTFLASENLGAEIDRWSPPTNGTLHASPDLAGVEAQLSLPFGDGGFFPAEEDESLLPLSRLPGKVEMHGSAYVPRILWALEWARRTKIGPQTAADIAKLLHEHGDIEVEPTNVARAFRDLKPRSQDWSYWIVSGRRYRITRGGSIALAAAMAADVSTSPRRQQRSARHVR